MTDTLIDQDAAWAAFERRDRGCDGRFVGAVKTTGIYCKPSCPARHPKREHVAFYRDGEEARAAGYRACLRCKPDEVGRDRIAVANAVALIEAAEEAIPLEELAAARRLCAAPFPPAVQARDRRDAGGLCPRPARHSRGRGAEVRGQRHRRDLRGRLFGAEPVLRRRRAAAGHDAERVAQGRGGGDGALDVADTSLGKLLIAATDKGLCRVAFDEDALALARHFPNAEIVQGGAALATLAARVVESVESPDRDHDLPLDVQGTAFQEAVWQALRETPAGETRTYAELAAAAGNPKAVRAAGTACGKNHVAVVVPCHRAQRSDGSIGGYAYGVDRKVALRTREGVK